MHYDKFTRLIHWGFALLIPLQLLSEEFMRRPKPGRIRDEVEIFFFEMHEWIGMAALGFVLVYLAWNLINAAPRWGQLFPYFSASHRQALVAEIKQEIPRWLKGQLTPPNNEQYLPKVVQGLGLLLVFAMGSTGAVMLYGMEDSGNMTGLVNDAKEVHEILGTLLWVYIIGHVGMSLLHKFAGHKIFSRIFGFKS